MTSNITWERLQEVLHYDPDSGQLLAKVNRGSRGKAGKVLGSVGSHKYLEVGVDNKNYLFHRLIWFYMTREWPKEDIDHINGDRLDNRWENLREATRGENLQNKRNHKLPKSGLRGAYQIKGSWFSQISIEKKVKYLGTYSSAEEAHKAFLEEKRKLHPFYVECE